METTWRCADDLGRQLTNVAETLLRKEPVCLEPRKGAVSTAFKLQASGDAASGDATVNGTGDERFDRAHFGSADLGGGPAAVLLMVNKRRSRRDRHSCFGG
jgi:hypothetical protein